MSPREEEESHRGWLGARGAVGGAAPQLGPACSPFFIDSAALCVPGVLQQDSTEGWMCLPVWLVGIPQGATFPRSLQVQGGSVPGNISGHKTLQENMFLHFLLHSEFVLVCPIDSSDQELWEHPCVAELSGVLVLGCGCPGHSGMSGQLQVFPG